MKVHHLTGYIQSIYLVEYPHGLLLLDGCCRADVAMLSEFIEQDLQRPLSDLKTLIVTHMHPDHAGAAHKLRRLTGCVIVSADKPNQWYRGFNGLLMHWIDMALTVYVARKLKKPWKNVLYSRKIKPDVKANEGDQVPHFPDWVLLETPGHTDRDLSVLHKEKNRVYVADLIIKLKRGFIAPFPVFHPNQYRRSLQQIKDLAPAKIMLAHGGMLHMQDADFDQMIEQAPKIPRTPLRASLLKIKRVIGK
ncbi:MAG: MBL fold metallo-hydrolase [Marinicella pacifica]